MTRKRKGHDGEEESAWHPNVIAGLTGNLSTGNLVTGNLEMPDRGRA